MDGRSLPHLSPTPVLGLQVWGQGGGALFPFPWSASVSSSVPDPGPESALPAGTAALLHRGASHLCSPRGRGLTLDIGHGVPAALTLPDLLRPTADRPVVGAALSQLQTDSSGVCPLWVLLRASSGALQSAPSPEAKAPP